SQPGRPQPRVCARPDGAAHHAGGAPRSGLDLRPGRLRRVRGRPALLQRGLRRAGAPGRPGRRLVRHIAADRRLRLFGQPGRFAARRRVDPRRPLHPHARPGPLPHGRGPAAPAALSAPRAGAPASIARGPPMTLPRYEIYALRYATVARRRAENFITPPDPHDGPMPMDYYVWVIRRDARVYLVDTGFNEAAARARGRRFLRCPIEALRQLGIAPDAVRDVIVTHLHYDHAGNIRLLPRARLHLQESELHYA